MDASDQGNTPIRLRADGRDAVEGTRFVATVPARPRLSWTVPLLRDGQRQTAFEVRVAPDDADPREEGVPAIVAVFEESGDPCTPLPTDLAAHSAFLWSVRIRDDRGEWSGWASPVGLETGPLVFDDWRAEWVSHPALATLRTSVSLDAAPARARLHLAAQGLVRAAVNGAPVNADASDPTRTDFVRALYRTYDVTDLCRTGDNTVDLTLAGGEWERTGEDPRVLAELVIDPVTGDRMRVGTSGAMRVAASEVTIAEPFYLERHEPSAAGTVFGPSDDLRVLPAVVAPPAPDRAPRDVAPDPTPPLHDVRTIDPAEIARVDGIRIYDVGVNVAGRSMLELSSPVEPGTPIRVVHGEHLDAEGRLDTTNLTLPTDRDRTRQVVEYATTGEAGQQCRPWFAYHGFRYLEVQGLPENARCRLTVDTHHTDLGQISRLDTDDGQVNRLIERAQRTLLNNVHGIPEDCPTREQAGWTGDTASVTEFEYSAFDMESFFRKWLVDLRTSQQADGAIPAIAPDMRVPKTPADPVWGAALQRALVNHWYHHGDLRVVEENLPALRRWADFQLAARDDTGVVSRSPISYGSDWLALQQTPPPIHHTAATIDCLSVLAELEEAVGEHAAATRRRAEADDLRSAARRAFYDETTGTFGNGSQGSYACAVEAAILVGSEATAAVASIEQDVRARGNRVSSGFATTRTVVRALAHGGRSQAVFDVLQQRAEPGVGAMADHGPGTLWECWWIDPYNTGTGSLDHVGLGGPFATWAWQHLAGIRPLAPGYARFEVAPQFVAGVERLALNTATIRGTIALDYRRDGDRLLVSLTVPDGAEAVVHLSGLAPRTVESGEHAWELPWPETVATRAPSPTAPWQPPSRAPIASDIRGPDNLLSIAIGSGNCTSTAASVEVLQNGIVCMPVPHAQQRGPVLRVIGDDPDADAAPTVLLTFTEPVDLSGARFAYAMLDLCLDTTTRTVEALIVLHALDGSSVEATGRIWPASWNRVSVDIGEWPGRIAVTAVEVGLRFTTSDAPMVPDGSDGHAPAFHLGEVGYSRAKRTW